MRGAVVVVPGRFHHHPSQVPVAGFGDAALNDFLAARMLGGDEPQPCGERPGVSEPCEFAGLEHDVGGGHDVDALQAAQRVDPLLPAGFRRLRLDQPLQPLLVFGRLPDGVDVVREDVVVGFLGELDRPDPCPMGRGPVPLPPAGRGGLVEYQAVPEQELGEPLLAAPAVVPRVVEGADQVARGFALVVGNPHLDDVADRQHAGQELRVVAVVLPAPVGAGLDHLRDGADRAVDAQSGQPLLQVEAGDAGLVDAFRGGVDGPDPVRHRGGVVAEGGGMHLAGHRIERGGDNLAGVDVEADKGGSMHHERAPSMNVAWPPLFG